MNAYMRAQSDLESFLWDLPEDPSQTDDQLAVQRLIRDHAMRLAERLRRKEFNPAYLPSTRVLPVDFQDQVDLTLREARWSAFAGVLVNAEDLLHCPEEFA